MLSTPVPNQRREKLLNLIDEMDEDSLAQFLTVLLSVLQVDQPLRNRQKVVQFSLTNPLDEI